LTVTKKTFTGVRFNKLTVICENGRSKEGHILWLCYCDCGNQVTAKSARIKRGRTTSCGCARFEGAKKRLSKNPRERTAKKVWGRKGRNNYSDGDLTFEKWIGLTQLPCHYCGKCSQESNVYNAYKRNDIKKTSLDNIMDGEFRYNGLDRIDSSLPHNINNVVPCCKICNSAKMATSYDDFLEWIKLVYNHISNK